MEFEISQIMDHFFYPRLSSFTTISFNEKLIKENLKLLTRFIQINFYDFNFLTINLCYNFLIFFIFKFPDFNFTSIFNRQLLHPGEYRKNYLIHI